MFVKPRKAVIDYLTPITGISEADLENVTSNLFDVQVCIHNHIFLQFFSQGIKQVILIADMQDANVKYIGNKMCF